LSKSPYFRQFLLRKDFKNRDIDRRYGEKVVGTLNTLATAVFEYPISALKDSARPAYWVPDDECLACCVCAKTFERAAKENRGSMQVKRSTDTVRQLRFSTKDTTKN
jgi:hypothetical protein